MCWTPSQSILCGAGGLRRGKRHHRYWSGTGKCSAERHDYHGHRRYSKEQGAVSWQICSQGNQSPVYLQPSFWFVRAITLQFGIDTSSFRINLAALSGWLCKVPQKISPERKKPTGFDTNRLCKYNLQYSVVDRRCKHLPYVICVPLIRKLHCHDPKIVLQPCDIRMGSILDILLVPALKQTVTDFPLFLC